MSLHVDMVWRENLNFSGFLGLGRGVSLRDSFAPSSPPLLSSENRSESPRTLRDASGAHDVCANKKLVNLVHSPYGQ